MTLQSREFYLNADFDPSLRGAPSLLESADPTYLHEMSWHYLFAAGAGDSLIVHRELPGDFLAYLESKGLALPRLVLHPAFTPASLFSPFGWNAHAQGLSARYAEGPAHPDLRIVRIANSRAFNLEVEREWGGADALGRLFQSLDTLETFLAARDEPLGWVAKGDHGHAGTANRRVPSGPLREADHVALAALFAGHGQVVLEPWHERLMDMSVGFTVGKAGVIRDFRGHILLNSRDGAFLGVRILPGRRPPEPWDLALEACAEELGRALDTLGYFGPVGMDAYVWNSPGGPRLRTLVDINARRSMSLPAHGLADRMPGKTLLWMWSKPRKLDLPSGYAEFDKRLDGLAFNPLTREGILAVSPLSYADGRSHSDRGRKHPDQGRKHPKRVGFLLSAGDDAGLDALQAGFSRALGRV
jgi:hypothetical protein